MQELARKLRQNPTPVESRLWQKLRASQLEDLKFRFQHVIEPYIVDFYCPRVGLVVEIDGHTHDLDKDRDRDIALAQLGYSVMRFTNAEVMANIEGVCQAIADRARNMPVRQWNRGNTHPPTPPLEGRGSK